MKNFILKFIVPLIAIIIIFNYNVIYGLIFTAGLISIVVFLNIGKIYAAIGKFKYMRGETQGSFIWYEKAYKTGKLSANNAISYAYLLLKAGDMQKAEQILNKVLRMKLTRDEKVLAKSNLALALWKKGEIDEAIEILREIHEGYKNSTIYGSLGYLMIAKGDLEQALKFNLEAYEYNDSDKIILDNLGQNYYLLGEYDKSEEIYVKLMDLKPTFPEPYYYYGNVLFEKGKKEEALETMKKALNYDFSNLSTISKDEVEERISFIKSQIQDKAEEVE